MPPHCQHLHFGYAYNEGSIDLIPYYLVKTFMKDNNRFLCKDAIVMLFSSSNDQTNAAKLLAKVET